MKLVLFAVNHIFMIYHPLLCGWPEVLRGGYSFEVLQGYALPCPQWLMLGCKCTFAHISYLANGLYVNICFKKFSVIL